MEAKYTAPISLNVTWDKERDQIGRVIDVGLDLAQDKEFFFLLVTDKIRHDPPQEYEQLLENYKHDPAFQEERSPHRTKDELKALAGHIGWLTWSDIFHIIKETTANFPYQKSLTDKLEKYLELRQLLT
ncbi:MAG: hypothetical protein HY665_09720 [Chloroflexi bacterium]|nr:hypothetical protein [Chloroflexota bacterium]